MIRLRLFGRCRIYHDPVSPVLKAPAQIGWDARFRTIDLVTPRRLKGRELLMRTRGWWTVEPSDVLDTVESHGKLVLGEKGDSFARIRVWGSVGFAVCAAGMGVAGAQRNPVLYFGAAALLHLVAKGHCPGGLLGLSYAGHGLHFSLVRPSATR